MPKIETSALLERLAKGQPMPGILLLGQESYLRDLCRRAIIEAVVPETARNGAWRAATLRRKEPSAILALAATPSLLAPRQVVFVRGVEAWEKLGEKGSRCADRGSHGVFRATFGVRVCLVLRSCNRSISG